MKTENELNKEWAVYPNIIMPIELPTISTAIWKVMTTKHEGNVLYYKYWNFWVRAGASADTRSNLFFRNYETGNREISTLLRDIGFPWRKAETEEEVWNRLGMIWKWIKNNVAYDASAYSTISSVPGEWPSIQDYAAYYADHGKLVWAACFSKAHLFATLIGRIIYPRFRFGIASAHHTEGGAPPTASHVFVGVYVSDRWFYLDPTAVYSKDFPAYNDRKSIGVDTLETVDYEHPFNLIPIPLSGFEEVPYLPK